MKKFKIARDFVLTDIITAKHSISHVKISLRSKNAEDSYGEKNLTKGKITEVGEDREGSINIWIFVSLQKRPG